MNFLYRAISKAWNKERSYKSNRLVTLLVTFAYLVGILVGMYISTANAADVDAHDKENTCYVSNSCLSTASIDNPFGDK